MKTNAMARRKPCTITRQMKVRQYRFLASAVLDTAIKDARIEGFKGQVRLFVDSDWCKELCEFAKVSYSEYVDLVHEAMA